MEGEDGGLDFHSMGHCIRIPSVSRVEGQGIFMEQQRITLSWQISNP